jgi:hypothetical protein
MKLRRVFLIIGVAAVIVAFTAVLIWVPKLQVASLQNAKGVSAQDVFKAENDARATLAQILGGIAVLIGLSIAWQNITATAKNLELTKEGQVTERFTKAIELLGATDDKGNRKLELRLGGGTRPCPRRRDALLTQVDPEMLSWKVKRLLRRIIWNAREHQYQYIVRPQLFLFSRLSCWQSETLTGVLITMSINSSPAR